MGMTRTISPGSTAKLSASVSSAASSGPIAFPHAGSVVVLSPELSNLMTGQHELQRQVSARVTEHLELVRKGEEELGAYPLHPLQVETWQSMDRRIRAQVDTLMTNNPIAYRATENTPDQFLDARTGSHSLFQVLLEVARLRSSVASGIGILTGSNVPLDARSATPATCGFGFDIIHRHSLSSPPIAWCEQSEVHLQDSASLESVITSVMQLKPFGFMEFVTGGIVMLGRVQGDSAIVPTGRLGGYGRILTGFELLAHIAQARGDTRPCTDLLSPVLSDTWRELHAKHGLELAERSAICLPLEYSRDLHTNLLLRRSGLSNSQIGWRWESIERGLRALILISRPLALQDTEVPVLDFLGRELWPSLDTALAFLREQRSQDRYDRQSEDEQEDAQPPTVQNKKVAEKARKLIESSKLVDPKERLLEGCHSRRISSPLRAIWLPEVDTMLAAPAFDAAALVERYGQNIDGLVDQTLEAPVHSVGFAEMDVAAVRGSLIPLNERKKLGITAKDGRLIFRSPDHFYNYQREVGEWMDRQIRCVAEAAGAKPSDVRYFVSERQYPVHQEYLDLLKGIGYLDEVSARELVKRRAAEHNIRSTTRLIAPYDLRDDLPRLYEKEATALCSRYPALWSLFFPRHVDQTAAAAADVCTVPGLTNTSAAFILAVAPGNALSYWEARYLKAGNMKESERHKAIESYVADHFRFKEKALLSSGLDDLRKSICKMGREWGTAPLAYKGKIFVDGQGRVIAENVGHYVSIYLAIAEVCIDAGLEIAKHYGMQSSQLIDRELLEETIGVWLDEFGDAACSRGKAEPDGLNRATGIRATLEALTDRTIQRALYNRKLSAVQAYKVLDEVVQQMFGAPAYSDVYDPWIEKQIFSSKSMGFKCSGIELIRYARGEKPGRFESPPGNGLQREVEGPSDGDSRLLIAESAPSGSGETPHKKPSKRETKAMRAERRRSLYQEMFRDREIPIGTLFLASCALGDTGESVSSYRAFKGALLPPLASSAKEEASPQNPGRSPSPPHSPVKDFTDFIQASDATAKKIDLSAVGRTRLANLLYQLCYRSFSGDVGRVISELEKVRQSEETASDHSRELAAQVLQEVVPILLRQLQRERDFKVPESILFDPFGYQRSWPSAVLSGEKPLLVSAPGSGKTEMGVLLAAAYLEGGEGTSGHEVPKEEMPRAPRRVLWLTTPSNIAGTSSRISQRISTPTLQLTADLLKRDPDDLRTLLSGYSFITFTYSSNAALWANRPDHFAVLTEWLHGGRLNNEHPSGLVIADEGHLLDNARSHRSQAVRALGAKHVAVLSGTPVQHRRENIATLLHTTLPNHYPDVDSLRRALKEDKTLALALFHQHATVIGMDEIARTFRPFSEMSAEEQLSLGLPCVPRAHEQFKEFSLSAEHTRRYINIALGEGEEDPSHKRTSHLRRYSKLRRLLANPTKLGAEPGYAMLQAVKEVALPAIRRGEKVIVLGEHLAPLELIASDPEMRHHGVALVTGITTPEERSTVVHRLVHDPSLMCGVGQLRVLGTGHDCPGVKLVIFIEPPRVVSDLLQGKSRHRRLVTKDTLPLAQSDVNVCYLRAKLDPDVVELVPASTHREILREGSVYERAMNRIVAQAEEYSELTSHPTKIKLEESTTVSEVVGALSKDLEALAKEREQFLELTDSRLEELFLRYRCTGKTAWREEDLGQFLDEALSKLKRKTSELTVALLPGPEALEVPVYCNRGITPSRIFAFEAHPDAVVREHCGKQVQRYGARFFSSRIEEILPRIEQETPIDIVSLDTNGYMTPELFEMVVSWCMPNQGILLKNALCGREQGAASELLRAAGGDRRELDRILLRLAGTQLNQTLQIYDMPALVVAARRIETLCRCVAEALSAHTGNSAEEVADLLMSYAYGGMTRVVAARQFEYSSSGGSPFLSSFALLERSAPEPRYEAAARKIGAELRRIGLQDGSSIESLSVKVVQRSGKLHVEIDAGAAIGKGVLDLPL
jgi:hypothetical protein